LGLRLSDSSQTGTGVVDILPRCLIIKEYNTQDTHEIN
jgi:hypothetical protein